MNEPLKTMVYQAIQELEFGSRSDREETLKRFAMLIIRECMDECGDITSARNIEEHFGIEIVWD